MEVMGWSRILRRRWWLALLLLLLTLAATAALAAKPGPYTAESQIALLPSKHISGPAGGNPYLSFGDSDTLTADLLRRELTAPASVTRLAAAGYSSTYVVADDPTTAGPVLDITVTGNSKVMVEHTLQGVTAAASTTLAGMQAGLSRSEQITSIVVSFAPEAELSVGKKARTLIVVFAVGLIFTIALPQAFDAAASRRRARRFGITPSSSKRSKAAPESVTATSLNRPAERNVETAADRPGGPLADSEADATIIFDRVAAAVPAGHQEGISRLTRKGRRRDGEATEF
jgi:hypothetical protein